MHRLWNSGISHAGAVFNLPTGEDARPSTGMAVAPIGRSSRYTRSPHEYSARRLGPLVTVLSRRWRIAWHEVAAGAFGVWVDRGGRLCRLCRGHDFAGLSLRPATGHQRDVS